MTSSFRVIHKMRKLFWLLLLGTCFGQVITDTALQNSAGNYARVVPFAPITVCAANDANVPCASVVTTYTSSTLGTACSLVSGGNGGPTSGTGCNNPGIADANGNFTVYVPGGQYTVCAYSVTWICVQKNGGLGISTGANAPKVGDITRWNINGDNLWDAVGYPQLYDGVFACNANVGCAVGMFGGAAPPGCCGESVTGVNPAAATPFPQTTYSAGASGSTSTVIGNLHSENGNTGQFFIRGFYRMSHRLSITPTANTRYWWGFGVWNNGSSLGSNGTNLLGTTVYAADSPNHTTVGWRWSSTTDANFKAVVIQAGASPTTVVIDTGVAVDSNLHTFDITLDSANSVFTFYIDGSKVGSTAASTITFSPSSAGDALGSLFFTGDNKNTATAVSLTFASMFISMRQ